MVNFDDAYRGTPPWDIGGPQPAFVALAEQGVIQGSVLDAGCGTGENALYFASLGHETWGMDGAPAAIEQARQKAPERGLPVEFRVHDALALEGLGRTFDTVTDSGLFHVFGDEDRARYVESLGHVLGSRRQILHALLQRPPARLISIAATGHAGGDSRRVRQWLARGRDSRGEIRATILPGRSVRLALLDHTAVALFVR